MCGEQAERSARILDKVYHKHYIGFKILKQEDSWTQNTKLHIFSKQLFYLVDVVLFVLGRLKCLSPHGKEPTSSCGAHYTEGISQTISSACNVKLCHEVYKLL